MEINTNWGLLGHEWAVDLLKGHLLNQRVRHAYLITGPQGVGRRSLAIRLAQALNCNQLVEHLTPCDECRACRLIEKTHYPDLSIVQTEEAGRAIKVDQIRELQRTLSLAPYEANFKTALLLNFEEANPNASNALLKTLEEPPSQVIILMTASDAEALLPTIYSRCELIQLRPLKINQVNEWLQTHWGLPAVQAKLLAHISGGRPGYALKLSQNPDALEQRRNELEDLLSLISKTRLERFSYAEELSKDKIALLSTLQTWLTFWRDIMLSAVGSTTPLTNIDFKDEIIKLTEKLELSTIQGVINRAERSINQIERYINARLVTEVFLLDLPRVS